MSEKRLQHIRSLDSLSCLVGHTSLLKLNEFERVEVVDMLPSPTDEHGIPRADIHINQLYENMTTKNFVWTGTIDLHHLCTPKADFNIVRSLDDGSIGSAFRGISQNKIELPRLMHNFGHAVVSLPGMADTDVMRMALFEVEQGAQLMGIINYHAREHAAYSGLPDEAKQLCLSALRSKLEHMKEPEVGMMPSLETMAAMDFDSLRTAVAGIVSIRTFGHKRLMHPAIRKPIHNRHAVTVAA